MQSKLAEMISRVSPTDVTKSKLGSWERRESNPSVVELAAICSALDVSAHWLLTGEGPQSASALRTGVVITPGAADEEVLALGEILTPAQLEAALAHCQSIYDDVYGRSLREIEAMARGKLSPAQRATLVDLLRRQIDQIHREERSKE